MGQAARVLGKPFTLRHRGQEYPVAPLDTDMLAMFECWLEDKAYQRVERHRGRCPDHLYRERLAEVTKLVTSGAFDYNGPLAVAASETEEGQTFLLWLRLSKNLPDATLGLAAEVLADQRDEYLAKVAAEEAAGPNHQTPAAS